MNPQSKRLAGFLCATAFLATVGVLVYSAPNSPAPGGGDCPGCMEKLQFIPTGDPDVDQANWEKLMDTAYQIQQNTANAARERRYASMSQWRGTVMAPPKDVNAGDVRLYESIGAVFAADPPAPEARKAEFAWCLDPEGVYRCVGYTAQVKSVTKNDQGWEVTLTVSPRIMTKRAAVVCTPHACVETWQVGKDGSLENVKCVVLNPNDRGPDSVVHD